MERLGAVYLQRNKLIANVLWGIVGAFFVFLIATGGYESIWVIGIGGLVAAIFTFFNWIRKFIRQTPYLFGVLMALLLVFGIYDAQDPT